MTEPAGGTVADITCALYVDGVRVADTADDAKAGTPTALEGLKVAWGRPSADTQPDASTCTFTVSHKPADGTAVAELLPAGGTVHIDASGIVPVPSPTNVVDDPTSESWTVDSPSTERQGHTWPLDGAIANTAAIPAGIARADHAGKGVQLQITDDSIVQTVIVLPRRLDSSTWAEIPESDSTRWSGSVHVTAPTSVQLRARWYVVDPNAGTATATSIVGPEIELGAGLGTWLFMPIYPASLPGDGWPAIGVEVLPASTAPAQTWAQTPGTWAAQTLAWYQYPGAPIADPTVWIDNLNIVTRDDSIGIRRVPVFTGRITDLELAPVETRRDPSDDSSSTVTRIEASVTAVEALAEYAHRFIGDVPWALESAQARADHITTAGNLPAMVVPDRAASWQLQYRDVDSQSAIDLARELADSLGCVLWLRTGWATGNELWLDDPFSRTPLRQLIEQDGMVVIGGDAEAPETITLSACDLLADPARMRLDTDTIVTIVDVTWQDTEGSDTPPTLVERHVTATDPGAVAQYGTRRLGYATQLASDSWAQELADRLLARARMSEWLMSDLTWDTSIGGEKVQSALRMLDSAGRYAAPLGVIDLPAWSPLGEALVCWLEGGTYSYDGGSWVLNATATPAAVAGTSIQWNEFDPDWTWEMLDRSIDWIDLIGIGAATGDP